MGARARESRRSRAGLPTYRSWGVGLIAVGCIPGVPATLQALVPRGVYLARLRVAPSSARLYRIESIKVGRRERLREMVSAADFSDGVLVPSLCDGRLSRIPTVVEVRIVLSGRGGLPFVATLSGIEKVKIERGGRACLTSR